MTTLGPTFTAVRDAFIFQFSLSQYSTSGAYQIEIRLSSVASIPCCPWN